MMTEAKFETLVRRLERYAKEQPGAYQFHVGALAALGYAYIFGVVLTLLALIAGVIAAGVWMIIFAGTHSGGGAGAVGAVKILIPLGIGLTALIGVVLRSFRVHFSEPEGFPIDRAQAPKLFAALDEICGTLQAPALHHVLVTPEYNASVAQHPRLGLFGGHVNFLRLGLPLMEAMSPGQYRAILAHEIGHLSRNHSRFSGWVYRVQATWHQMLDTLIAERHSGVSLFLPFFSWYSPYFAAYSFVLRRGNEYVADKCAAQVAGAETTAQMLVSLRLKGRMYQQEFWGGLLKQAKTEPRMPDAIYAQLQESFHRPSGHEMMWYEDALEDRTDLGDTHPSLTERLAALGFRSVPGGPLDLPKLPLPLPPPVTETAAEFFLGSQISRIAAPIDQRWRMNIADAWVKTHQKARLDQIKLDELEAKVVDGTVTHDEAWQRTALIADLCGEEEALPLVQEFLAVKPDHEAANFIYGKMLLERKDARGLPFLQKAIAATPAAVGPGCNAISWFYREQGKMREAATYRERGRTHTRQWEAGQTERAEISPDDKFLYHGLLPEPLAKLRWELGQMPEIWRAYLVRKQVRHFPEMPLYVLGLVPSATAPPNFAEMVGSRIDFPGETFLVVLQGDGKKFEKPFSQLATATIVSR
jgi:hypothetical protein